MTDKLLKASEVSRSLGITDDYLYRLARNGEIGTIRIGKRGVRFPESEVRGFVEKMSKKK